VEEYIIKEIKLILDDPDITLNKDSELIGGSSILDSMSLVSLCLKLAETAEEQSFEFDWTSEAAMSRTRSMFRTIGALAEEFENQRKSA